jgi:hypothetical protein
MGVASSEGGFRVLRIDRADKDLLRGVRELDVEENMLRKSAQYEIHTDIETITRWECEGRELECGDTHWCLDITSLDGNTRNIQGSVGKVQSKEAAGSLQSYGSRARHGRCNCNQDLELSLWRPGTIVRENSNRYGDEEEQVVYEAFFTRLHQCNMHFYVGFAVPTGT